MQLTMTGEYAIRAMLHLAALPFGTIIQISIISKEWGIPDNFLRKIIPNLSKAGLVMSQRGIGGGVQLAKSPETMTLYEVIEAVEGKMRLNKCLVGSHICERTHWCSVHLIWEEAQRNIKEILSRQTLAEISASNRVRQEKFLHSQDSSIIDSPVIPIS